MQTIIRMDLGGVNCYLIENNKQYVLIDTGGHMFMDNPYTNREELLLQKLDENGITKDNLKLILLTHGDNDHANNALAIRNHYGAPIAIGEKDAHMVTSSEWDCYKANLKYNSLIMTLVCKCISGKIERLMHKVYSEFRPFTPDILIQDKLNLSSYGFDATVYSTPGHTNGSLSVLTKEGDLICGDMFACIKKPSLAPNASDFKELAKQAKRMMEYQPKNIFPGHGEPFEASKWIG